MLPGTDEVGEGLLLPGLGDLQLSSDIYGV